MSLHGLRHTHASLTLRTGTDMKTIQDRLGHSTMAMTSDLYSHVMPDLKEEALARLSQVLR